MVKSRFVLSIACPALLAVSGGLWLLGAADKDEQFRPEPAANYSSKQTIQKVTIAWDQYEEEDRAKAAFSKLDPNQYGILPVLIVIQNDSAETIRLDNVRALYIWPDGTKVEPIPAADVPYIQGPSKPKVSAGPIPGRVALGRKKNKLAGGQIDVRAFSAKLLPPGESASGFLYFLTGPRRESSLYLTGLTEASSGNELFYFEIPLKK